jgi:hypothetical protein
MEIIIGRDKQTSKLRMSVGQQAKLFGANGSVPLSVSREHLSLTINPDCTYNAKNLNAQNSTFVNGVSIEKLSVTEKDSVEMGADHYPLDWSYVRELQPKIADISHLQEVWDEYNKNELDLTVKERRANALRSGTGLLTMGAIAVGFILGKEQAGAIYMVLYGVAILISALFFIKSLVDAGKIPQQRQKQKEKFQHDYTCPNCGRFLSQPYDQIRLMDNCPYCKVMFRK